MPSRGGSFSTCPPWRPPRFSSPPVLPKAWRLHHRGIAGTGVRSEPLDAGAIRVLLDELGDELVRRGVRAELFIVGGAAMALRLYRSPIDPGRRCRFEPKEIVRQAAAIVGVRRGLAADWLNDAAKGYLPGPDPDRVRTIDRPGLVVDVAPRYLLVMKLLAARPDDVDDIRILYAACGFTTPAEGLDLLEATYPRHIIRPETQFLLEEPFPPTPDPGGHSR